MRKRIPEAIRARLAKQAGHCCEYCLIHESDTIFPCEIDHIISLKHGGTDHFLNFAFTCFNCNRNKGNVVAIILPPDLWPCMFFNPRLKKWSDYFQLNGNFIEPLNQTGAATIKVLQLNHFERLIERAELIADGRYPHIF